MNVLPFRVFRGRKSRVWFFVLTSLFFSPVLLADVSFEKRFSKEYLEGLGAFAYEYREIPGNLALSNRYLQQALQYDFESDRIHWKLARNFWILGREAKSPEKRKLHYQKAIDHAKKAIALEPEVAVYHSWMGIALGSLSLEKGVLNSIYLKEEIKREFDRALQLNPKDVLALLGMANWYFAIPEIFGGSKTAAFQLVEKALKLEPDYSESYLLQAEFYRKSGRIEEAKTSLKQLLKLQKTRYRTGMIENRPKAADRLRQLNELNP